MLFAPPGWCCGFFVFCMCLITCIFHLIPMLILTAFDVSFPFDFDCVSREWSNFPTTTPYRTIIIFRPGKLSSSDDWAEWVVKYANTKYPWKSAATLKRLGSEGMLFAPPDWCCDDGMCCGVSMMHRLLIRTPVLIARRAATHMVRGCVPECLQCWHLGCAFHCLHHDCTALASL
jgi:hypothetical protein